MNQIFKPKQLHTMSKYSLSPTIEPTSVSQAISQPHWCEAMSNELIALMKHGTWDLVLPSSNCKHVGCKWVFQVKRKIDGSMERFKACLVAKGYHQCPGVDCKETFSLVIKPTTIRAVLSIAIMNGWDLRQLDINNAFLNGELSETVFKAQPLGFKDLSKPNHVCRLNKAIYGLKQAPRAWYTTLKMPFFSWVFTIPKRILLSSFTAMVPIFVISWFMLMILSLQGIIPYLWPLLLSNWVTCFLSRIWVLFIFS